MTYVLAFLLYIYVFTGVFLSIKLFKHKLGQIIMAVYFGLFWLPILIAEAIAMGVRQAMKGGEK